MADNLNENEQARRRVLEESKVIAIVGQSSDHYYSSYDVREYLILQGYTVYGVNPFLDEVEGAPVYDTLADVPEPVDIVDVFRKSDYLMEVVEEAIAIRAKTVWAQLDVVDDFAARRALDAGLNFAQNLCIRTEHERLFGE
jgi:predicted CoA-binding protein